jgi:hypothetical protein
VLVRPAAAPAGSFVRPHQPARTFRRTYQPPAGSRVDETQQDVLDLEQHAQLLADEPAVGVGRQRYVLTVAPTKSLHPRVSW